MIKDITEQGIESIINIAESSIYITINKNNMLSYINNKIYKCLCYENNYVVLGFIIATIIESEAEIIDIAVSTLHKRKNIGACLFNNFLEYSKTKNVKRIILDVNENNYEALSFYEKNNFKKYGVRKNYYTKPQKSDAILMEFLL